ncbi:MAG: HIT domain-containing protein, partial [Bacteriovoracaceae bacterium]|nr:HIT domain-containing protein [Bacteriovoracaceae bacterium]
MGCIFCKIVNNEVPSNRVYEDDLVVAFDDIQPLAPVHTIVIPRKHYAGINDL